MTRDEFEFEAHATLAEKCAPQGEWSDAHCLEVAQEEGFTDWVAVFQARIEARARQEERGQRIDASNAYRARRRAAIESGGFWDEVYENAETGDIWSGRSHPVEAPVRSLGLARELRGRW